MKLNGANNYNVLPFYSSKEYWHSKRWYTYGQVCPVAARKDYLVPFQLYFTRDVVSTSGNITLDIKRVNDDFTVKSFTLDHSFIHTPEYVIIKFPEQQITALPLGLYYYKVTYQETDDSGVAQGEPLEAYSDILSVMEDESNFVRLEYWNASDIITNGYTISFADNFKFVSYIHSTIAKPDYEFEEELTKRLGYKFIETQVSTKVYKFNYLATEANCDAMRIARMCDYIKFTTSLDVYNALYMSFEVAWQDYGDVANLTVEFETDTIIQRLESFKRSDVANFYNALLYNINEPILFDYDTIAQYYSDFSGQGKMIRELDQITVDDITPASTMPIDLGQGAAKKIAIEEIFSKYSAFNEYFGFDEINNAIYVKGNRSFYTMPLGDIIAGGYDESSGSVVKVEKLTDIGDVRPDSLNANDLLKYDGTNWVTIPLASISSKIDKLTDINDVTPINLTAGDLLKYDGSKWVNIPMASISGKVEGITLNNSNYYPDETTKLITLPNYPTTLPASDVYSWAKQPNKPSYSFGELSSHPTTLGGYGITDAYTKSDADSRYRQLNTSQFYGDEVSSYYRINRASDGGGGWAYSPIRMYKGDKASQILNIGATGHDSNISFVFIGSQDYGNRNNLRIHPDGDVWIGSSMRAVSPVSEAQWQFGYSNASFSGIVMHDISQHNNTKALYIQTNGYDARNDTGGLAITNDCVTAFGAGDNGSIFRVLNENDVDLGALFNVAKDGTLTRLGNRIWDEGNDGSGSGLDADLLDGKHLHQGQWNSICYIGGDGVLEIGKYIDFHEEQGMSSDFSCRIMTQGDYQNTLFLPTSSGTLATLGDNVYSASKLTTPRTIFSKPFDGTGNVTGGAKFANICIETDNNGNDSGRGSKINNYNDHLYLQYDSPNNLICCMSGGNVGIGSLSTSGNKLYVNGDVGVAGTIYFESLSGGNERNLLFQQMADNDLFRIRCGGPSNQGWVEIATADDGTEPIYVRQYTGEFASITRTLTLLDGNGDTYCPGKITSGNWIRSNLYSAGIDGYADDLYSAAYNACAPNNDNYCCYSIVRSGTIPLGIGFNTSSEIWLGTANIDRKAAAQWLRISGNRVTCSSDIFAYGEVAAGSASDLRLKEIQKRPNYANRLLKMGLVRDYYFNDLAKSRDVRKVDNDLHTGMIYQDVLPVLSSMCGVDDDGYGKLNYIKPDFICTIAGATQDNTIELIKVNTRMSKLETAIRHLKRKINKLERKLSYEQASIQ